MDGDLKHVKDELKQAGAIEKVYAYNQPLSEQDGHVVNGRG
jgi:hypothetical protein